MKIAVDLSCLQTKQSKERGIGFFTQELIRSLLALDSVNEYVLLYNARFREPDLLASLSPSGRWYRLAIDPPTPGHGLEPEDYDRDQEFRFASRVESMLLQEGVDLVHVASPFEWELYTPVRYRSLPVVATVFDLIPLVFHEEYLDRMPPWMQDQYYWTCEDLTRVDRMVTISDTSRDDICRYLEVPRDRVDVVFASAKQCFTVLSDSRAMEKVRKRFRLDRHGFVLCTAGMDYRKNVERVIESFSLLSTSVRERYKLVIVCQTQSEDVRRLTKLGELYGVSEELVFTGYVSDETLVHLYNAADAFLFPSLYEGFGLPVLEALQCGVPVVTSAVSSLPEVAGDAALLVDPESSQQIAQALEKLLTDETLRSDLRSKGLRQAQEFTPELVARRTLAAYESVVAERQEWQSTRDEQEKPRIAVFSPLSPQQSGVSEATEDLLPLLGEYYGIDLFVDGYAPTNRKITDRFPVFDYREFEAMAAIRGYDSVVYSMGNSSYHTYIYDSLLKHPGIVILHDFVLHGLIYHMTAEQGAPGRYVEEMRFCNGEDGERRARRILSEGLTLEERYGIDLNKRVVSLATGIVTQSHWARHQLRSYGLPVPITTIPLGVPVPDGQLSSSGRDATLRDLSIPTEGSLVICSYGYVAVTKRPHVLVRAFARFQSRYPKAVLVFVGEVQEQTISELIVSLGIADSVRVLGYVDSSDEAHRIISAADVCVHLRYPSAGETSAAIMRTMGLGKAQVISSLSQFQEIPDDCCWKLDRDEFEEDTLVAYLLELAADVQLRMRMGENARRYVLEHNKLEQSAAAYAGFIQSVGNDGKHPAPR